MPNSQDSAPDRNVHQEIIRLVRAVPAGRVASYGMIASLVNRATPRVVGFAMAGLEADTSVPWHRIINASGGISPRPGADLQRERLEAEGITFTKAGKLNWALYAWEGPDPLWCDAEGLNFEDVLEATINWPARTASD